MLFKLYNSRVIPNFNYDPYNKDKDYSEVRDIIGPHSELPNKNYNYIFNKDGLRSIEFSTKPEVVALGCSITLGQGLPVELRWSDILSKKIEQPIGNISYSGAAINKCVSSFFGMINQYNYIPKTVICNFANFERFYFVDENSTHMRDWYINYSPKVTKAHAPWNYQEILPYEWVYYQNLDHIKMLEVFCKSNNINLIWSCWSNALNKDQEAFLLENFENYVQDPVRKQFPDSFEFNVYAQKISELRPYYKMIDWNNIKCHLKEYGEHEEIFDYGYDKNKIAGKWGSGSYWPHPGVHKQTHWAEFYYDEIIKKGWV